MLFKVVLFTLSSGEIESVVPSILVDILEGRPDFAWKGHERLQTKDTHIIMQPGKCFIMLERKKYLIDLLQSCFRLQLALFCKYWFASLFNLILLSENALPLKFKFAQNEIVREETSACCDDLD